MSEPELFVITGIMAAGKTSIAEVLAARFGRGVHLSGDWFRRSIVSGRADMSPDPTEAALSQLELRHLLAADAADRYVQAGFSVVLQDTFLGAYLPFVLEALSTRPVSVVVLCPTPAVVEQRERARDKVGYVGFSPADLDGVLRAETPPIGLWLDTSDLSVAETVTAILDRRAESLWV
jgi:predicted kinase